jgi:DNA polymerase-3 subunit gamma/tau
LIKLSYLGQALQLTGEPGGKKKALEGMRPVSFRNIPPMEPRKSPRADTRAATANETGNSGNQIALSETERREPAIAAQDKPIAAAGATQRAKLLVDTDVKAAGGASQGTSLGSLSKIRQQFSSRQQNSESQARPLEPAALAKAWAIYARQLRENKNPAVQSLELADLRIIDVQSFTVVTGNNLEQKFIEQEKRTLSEFLQKEFANKAISFTVIVEEKPNTGEPAERPLNTREQFLQIVGQYPLVKELKDRLKLELDY